MSSLPSVPLSLSLLDPTFICFRPRLAHRLCVPFRFLLPLSSAGPLSHSSRPSAHLSLVPFFPLPPNLIPSLPCTSVSLFHPPVTCLPPPPFRRVRPSLLPFPLSFSSFPPPCEPHILPLNDVHLMPTRRKQDVAHNTRNSLKV